MSSVCSNCSEHNYCEGYQYCLGHEVNTYTLNLDGLYPILMKHSISQINALEALRAAEHKDQKNNCKISRLA